MAMAACSCGDGTEEPWASEAVSYYEGLADAYSANDYYGVLDYYAVDAFQEKWRGDIHGGLLVRDLLIWDSAGFGHELLNTYVGEHGAITLVRWEQGGLSAVVSDVRQGRIEHEVVFDHGAWREAGLRSAPAIVDSYEEEYSGYAAREGLTEVELTQTVNATSLTGPAVFLGPAGFSSDPGRAIGVFEVSQPESCRGEIAVLLHFEGAEIIDEETYIEAGTLESCRDDDEIGAWVERLTLPGPRDRVVTGEIATQGGSNIGVRNGTPALEDLVRQSLGRFVVNGLAEPRIDTVTFEPTRRCIERSGRLIQSDGVRDVYLCIYESDLCSTSGECEETSLGVRAGVLHELAHAWILDHVGPGERADLLAIAGLEYWDDPSVDWPLRGVEYAAEVVTWGVLEETAPMVRIGSPPCDEMREAFIAMTGSSPGGRDC